jgi:pimeloyl-ACP methyl ester carboxylesterase
VPPTPELFEDIPGVRVEVFDRSGHFPYCEEEREFARRYRDWVKSLEGSAVGASKGAAA